MKITDSVEWTVLIGDIETLKCMSLFSFYNPDNKEWIEFEISAYRNDLLKFVGFYKSYYLDYIVWYNGISFDCPVIEHVLRHYKDWVDLDGVEIAAKIWQYAQDVIDDKKFGKMLEYQEKNFSRNCIDVFTLNGLDNEARRSSLKKIEFQLDWPSVEEMPIEHNVTLITKEDTNLIREYCRNDILATYELFKLSLGRTEHPVYKGNNQVELRLNVMDEFKLPCLSYSDIKIGDELMKKSYAEAKKMQLWEVPKKGHFRRSIKLRECIPDYVSFKTPTLNKLLKDLKRKEIRITQEHEVTFNYGAFNTKYTIGLGGGHSTNTGEIWYSDDEFVLVDLDVGSLYPALICNEGYTPKHLGKELLKIYKQLYERRIELKPLSKKDKKIKGLCDAIKLLLNSAYGKMGSIDSWMYDKQVPYAVCLTGQMNLLMLIEEMEMEGICCFSFNTDGATFRVSRKLMDRFYEICKGWEKKTNLVLEEARFSKLYYASVSDYIGIKEDGSIKVKGDFVSDNELWKNKSWKIVGMALQEYFSKGVSPEDFIKGHRNIYDFCLMSKANGNLYLELEREGETQKLKKLVRYYLSKDSDWKLYKRGVGSTGKNMNVSQHADNELGAVHVEYFNQYVDMRWDKYGVDVNQYIFKTLSIIDRVERGKKAKAFLARVNQTSQLSMF